jgi:hypothetical protein
MVSSGKFGAAALRLRARLATSITPGHAGRAPEPGQALGAVLGTTLRPLGFGSRALPSSLSRSMAGMASRREALARIGVPAKDGLRVALESHPPSLLELIGVAALPRSHLDGLEPDAATTFASFELDNAQGIAPWQRDAVVSV